MKRSKQRRIWEETRKNKIYAILLLAIGAIPGLIFGEWSGIIVTSIFAIPLLFAKENVIH